MKRLLAPVLLLALFTLLPAGCNNPAKLIAVGLKIEVTRLERTSDGTVLATWHVENSNVVSYLVSHVSHKIYLNGVYLGVANEDEPMAIPATSNAGRTSKLTGGSAEAAPAVTAALASGSGSYRIDSQFIFGIYDDKVQKSELANTGTVPVTAK